jgi:hypothetical protein
VQHILTIIVSILLYMVLGPLVFFLTYFLPAKLILWLFDPKGDQRKRILIILSVVGVLTVIANYFIERKAADDRAAVRETERQLREGFMSSPSQNSCPFFAHFFLS